MDEGSRKKNLRAKERNMRSNRRKQLREAGPGAVRPPDSLDDGALREGHQSDQQQPLHGSSRLPISREGLKAGKCTAAGRSCSLYTVQGLGAESYQPPNVTHFPNPKQKSS